jgi:AraC-like DNA-binding protein
VDSVANPYLLRYDEFAAGSFAEPHRHRLGHLNFTVHGTMSIDTDGLHMVAPPQYGVWIPPRVEHHCHVQHAAVYRSFYVQPDLCDELPQHACILRISPIVRSILADFAQRDMRMPQSPEDLRLAQVMVDQLRQARSEGSYLPQAQEPALTAVLDGLRADPGNRQSMAAWAAQVHMTERTLARHCQRELGMALGEWRQRLRHLRAVEALGQGQTVQEIAFDLGYSTASAFIAMFQRETGMSPDQFRRELVVAKD